MKKFLLLGVLAVAMFAGCKDLSIFPDGGKGKNDPPKSLTIKNIEGKEYKLVSWQTFGTNDAILGSQITNVPAGQKYTIRFLNGQVNGQIDCNSYMGTYTELPSSHNLMIAPVVVTDAVCGSGSLDNLYLNSLKHTVRYAISDNSLKIYWQPEVSIPEDTTWVMNFVLADIPDTGGDSSCNIIPSFAPFSLLVMPPSAPFMALETPVIENDVLLLNVGYSGGCQKHSFSGIIDMDSFDMPGMPATGAIPLMVLHDNGGDDCEAAITEKLRICLGDLKKELYNRYLLSSSSTNVVLIEVRGENWKYMIPFKFR